MPKSRNRPQHKKAVSNYKKRVVDQKKSYERQLRELFQKKQQEQLQGQLNNDSNIEGTSIDVGEFQIEEPKSEFQIEETKND
jgi:hypothetical protein